MRPRRKILPEISHAGRVALAAALLVGIVYAACVAVLDAVVASKLVAAVDSRLAERISDVREVGLPVSNADDDDIDATPVYLWRITPAGALVAAAPGAPRLPSGFRLAAGKTETIRLPAGQFRVYAARAGSLRLIAGQSLAGADHLGSVLRDGEALAAPVLLLAMFVGALTIGVRALSPVEQSRRRQLEFTADASHELRTPLSVISAETSVALSAPRSPAEYRAVLGRIESESSRLAKIVEDLLWLARFDSAPPQPGYEPLDLATIAATCAERFRAVASTQQFQIALAIDDAIPAWISAPPEWIDRLAGVLVDNACRYAAARHPTDRSADGQSPAPGTVRISVLSRGNRVCLIVEDSGPGVAPQQQAKLFDRFHRSTEQGGSAGLGLAIADSIVRSTSGQWRLGDSALGGALFEVSWRRVVARQHASAPALKQTADGGQTSS
jgi:signal transduction histidine kinase